MFNDYLIKLIGRVCNTSTELPRSPFGTASAACTSKESISTAPGITQLLTHGSAQCTKLPSSMLTGLVVLSHSCISAAAGTCAQYLLKFSCVRKRPASLRSATHPSIPKLPHSLCHTNFPSKLSKKTEFISTLNKTLETSTGSTDQY